MAYVIKRYSNRKLYDTQESRYVTLEEIEEMIRAGSRDPVVDAASGKDLTSVTLTQIILENERTRQASLPPAFLHQLIKHGECLAGLVQKSMRVRIEGIVSSSATWSGSSATGPRGRGGERCSGRRRPPSPREGPARTPTSCAKK